MQIGISMPGLAELDKVLGDLGHAVATEIGSDAIKASADLLRDAWQLAAPYDPRPKTKSWTLKSGEVRSKDYGHLNQNIRVGSVTPEKENAVVFKVTTGNAFWGYFVEIGTVKMRPQPWARPELERLKSALVNVQIETLRDGIESVVGNGATAAANRPTLANGRNL